MTVNIHREDTRMNVYGSSSHLSLFRGECVTVNIVGLVSMSVAICLPSHTRRED